MHILAEHFVNALVSQNAEAGGVAERASVFEINSVDQIRLWSRGSVEVCLRSRAGPSPSVSVPSRRWMHQSLRALRPSSSSNGTAFAISSRVVPSAKTAVSERPYTGFPVAAACCIGSKFAGISIPSLVCRYAGRSSGRALCERFRFAATSIVRTQHGYPSCAGTPRRAR